jgi:transcriptional regulator with XRE-family HTH domain
MSVDLRVEAGEASAGTEADAVFWDDAGFIRRVNQEADKLGVSLNEVCRRAGLSKDYLGKTPQGGRNVLSIQKLAAVLGVEPAYLMDFATEVHIKPNPPTREETQLQALGLAANIAAHVSIPGDKRHGPNFCSGRMGAVSISFRRKVFSCSAIHPLQSFCRRLSLLPSGQHRKRV